MPEQADLIPLEEERLPFWARPWTLLLLGAAIFFAYGLITGWPSPVVAQDLSQQRANTALPPPDGELQVEQTFTAGHGNLVAVELLLVRYNEDPNEGTLQIQLYDDGGNTVDSERLILAGVTHNQVYTLRFPPQPGSAGRRYTLLVTGRDNDNISLWGYDLDVHTGGNLAVIGGETAARELRLNTYYQLSFSQLLEMLWRMISANGGLLLLALALIFMPGRLLLELAWDRTRRWDPAARWGVALATGLSAWPLLWLWLTVVNGRWTGLMLWMALTGGWALVFVLYLRRRRFFRKSAPTAPSLAGESRSRRVAAFGARLKRRIDRRGPFNTWRFGLGRFASPQASWHHAVLLLLLLFGLAVRLLAVRDLAFPPWVDASRHGLITAVMVENGQVMRGYNPFLPVDRFPYHDGFHALPASLALMVGPPATVATLPRQLLLLGQLLNGLMPLSLYAGGYLLTRRRSVALLAAFLVGLPFLFPGYYATWGRMTQLTGMLILPIALALTWRLVRGARSWGWAWWLAGLLATGIFLVHFRIFLLFILFAITVWALSFGRRSREIVKATILALVLGFPRILQLFQDTRWTGVLSSSPGYNDFPVGYVYAGWERAYLWAAAASMVLVILAGLRSRRWALLPLFLTAWVGLTALSLSGDQIGLPQSFVININSAYISFFLPLALLLAVTADRLWRWLARRRRIIQAAGYLLTGGILMALLIFGVRQQVTILNPQTILAWPEDLPGLAWLKENTDPSARVAVNSWQWLGSTWAGSDGGAWIVPLVRRDSTDPPVDYGYSAELASVVGAFNEAATGIEDWSDPASAAWLRGQGVTHVYVGAKGGFLDPAALAKNPELAMVYARDGAFIFTLDADG